jgi:NAD(P)-dependent dehydrogenase (short-subunit alcohol dehydrogenase family)
MANLTNKTALITGVAFLASDAARWITGASIPVDGGSKL